MNNVLIPFALRNGESVFISQILQSERGKKCGCICPDCNEELLAKLGKGGIGKGGKRPHFSHNGKGCGGKHSYTAGYYLSLKRIFDKGCQLYIPGEKIGTGKFITFDRTELSYDKDNHIQALIAIYNNRSMAIKVRPLCKRGRALRHESFSTLELNFRKDNEKIQAFNDIDEFREYVSQSKTLGSWIWNLSMEKKSQLIEKNRTIPLTLGIEAPAMAGEVRERSGNTIIIEKLSKEIPRKILESSGYPGTKALFVKFFIHDEFGVQWLFCNQCGTRKQSNEFWKNNGKYISEICYDCRQKNKI